MCALTSLLLVVIGIPFLALSYDYIRFKKANGKHDDELQ